MESLRTVNPFKISVVNSSFGRVTTFSTELGQTLKAAVGYRGGVLFATDIKDKKHPFSTVFVHMDTEGANHAYLEADGIMPSFFLSPEGEAFMSIEPYDPDKDMEISIPLFNREEVERPSKGSRPFLGDFVGNFNTFAILYDVNPWDRHKPDKMLAIEFKNGKIKKKNQVKIPLPTNNSIRIQDEHIHLLALEGEKWLHRSIDEKGNILRERWINPTQRFFSQVLCLSFEKESHILQINEGMLFMQIVSPEGVTEDQFLFDIQDPFYNTWPAVLVGPDTYIVKFNNEFGNGWFTMVGRELVEFYYSKGVNGYKNLITGEVFAMEMHELIIFEVVARQENAYAVLFYPYGNTQPKKEQIIVLERTVDTRNAATEH